MKPRSTTARPAFEWSRCWKPPTSRSASAESWSTSDSSRFISSQILSFPVQPKKEIMNPTVLIVTTSRWYPTARLAIALASAGCKVEMVCPKSHPAQKTKAVRRTHVYRGLAPLTSFARAIAMTQPDFIVSADDLATQHLHRLYAREKSNGKDDSPICALIERSLGAPESFPVVNARAAFVDMAHEEGV